MKLLNKTKYKGYRITTWFVTPIGFTYKVSKNGADVYIGSGEEDIYNTHKYAREKAKYIIDNKLNGLRICKLHSEKGAMMIRTDADNDEINKVLSRWKPETDEWDNETIIAYLKENVKTGKIENITKED